jgi:hypothetical protein
MSRMETFVVAPQCETLAVDVSAQAGRTITYWTAIRRQARILYPLRRLERSRDGISRAGALGSFCVAWVHS